MSPPRDETEKGRLIRFPFPRAELNNPVPAPALDYDPIHDVGADVVDPEIEKTAVEHQSRRSRPFERRPLLPPWVFDGGQRWDMVRWLVAYLAHTTAFHLIRSPKYVARTVMYAPCGAWRAVAAGWRWTFDIEGRPLRHHAVERGDIAGYMVLSRQRNERVRMRLSVLGTNALLALLVLVVLAATSLDALALLGVPFLAGLGFLGRRADRPFLDPAVISQEVRKLTPDLVVRAFMAAGLCKEDDPITFPQPICRDGRGWLAVLDLPFGKKATDALKKREDIAAGLSIDEVKVFLDRQRGDGGSARRISLWVSDVDVFAQKPRTTPLAGMESLDFWKGFPFGLTARGKVVTMSLVWTSLLVGAIPRMGKTFAARLAAAAAALDPCVRLFVFDGKGGKDWQPFELVAHQYGSGIRDAVVEHLLTVLRELQADMNHRYEKLRTLPNDLCPEGKLTPGIARNRRLDMPLVLVCVDEVQRYLEHEAHGKEILALLTDLVKVGPAVGVMVVLATQKPDAKTIPDGLRGQMGTRFAMKVMNWQSSDAILGAGSYPELDASKLLRSHKGVGILVGGDDGELAEEGAQIVRCDLMDLPALQKICERARALRIAAGTLSGVAAGEEVVTETGGPRLLDDVLAVFRADEPRLWSETVVARLATSAPAAYDGWTPTDLANALRPYGVSTDQVWGQTADGKGANRRGITRDAVLSALAERIDRPHHRPNHRPEGR